ncbi:MAG: hypothetical protein EA403_12305 [Spirochaetaceae bacterium]|nr:MAG: hypothetical protein EA403_12305 [Spirochaetaceae bacterium]
MSRFAVNHAPKQVDVLSRRILDPFWPRISVAWNLGTGCYPQARSARIAQAARDHYFSAFVTIVGTYR